MKKLVILGATGLVGNEVVRLALQDGRVEQVVAPTRRPLSPHPKLENRVSDRLDDVLESVAGEGPNGLICALGTTIKKAGGQTEFRHVDYELPIAFARRTYSAGNRVCAVVTAIGASTSSAFFYATVKGEVERDMRRVGFDSLTLVRPSIISGDRAEHRAAEWVVLGLATLLRPVLPKGWRSNSSVRIAQVLFASVMTPKPGITLVQSWEMT